MHRRRVKQLVIRALELGARQITPFEVEWDISGDCLAPVRREIFARKGKAMVVKSYKTFDDVASTFENGPGQANPGTATYFADRDGPYCVQLTARCRKCAKCLRRRSKEWAMRAWWEIQASSRTWFGSLTIEPEHRYMAELKARNRLHKRGTRFDELNGAEQFQALHETLQPEVTKMLKRWRKAGHRFRYLLVLEPHENGWPHYHLFVHEQGVPIRYDDIKGTWPLGYDAYKLVDRADKRAAWYAAKYLGKNASARVRASLHYGRFEKLVFQKTEPPPLEKVKRVPLPKEADAKATTPLSTLPPQRSEEGGLPPQRSEDGFGS